MVTSLATKYGASGSADGAGLPAPAALQPDVDVQVSQLESCEAPLPFVPIPVVLLMLLLLQTRTVAPVGFQTELVRSWNTKQLTLFGEVEQLIEPAVPAPG
jgi:hypothetical protein